MKMFKKRSYAASKWIADLVEQIAVSKIGQFFLKIHENETSVKTSLIRQNFSALQEDALVISLSVIYGFMFKKLMPDGWVLYIEAMIFT